MNFSHSFLSQIVAFQSLTSLLNSLKSLIVLSWLLIPDLITSIYLSTTPAQHHHEASFTVGRQHGLSQRVTDRFVSRFNFKLISCPFRRSNRSSLAVTLVERTGGQQFVNSFRTGRHESEDIVALASQIKEADVAVRNTASNKLTLILEQIRFLQSQAEKILQETAANERLHHAACNFKKIPGTIYHLYERESGQTYFSMLSLEEWGPNFKHKHLGSNRPEGDHSWTPLEEVEKRSEDQRWSIRF